MVYGLSRYCAAAVGVKGHSVLPDGVIEDNLIVTGFNGDGHAGRPGRVVARNGDGFLRHGFVEGLAGYHLFRVEFMVGVLLQILHRVLPGIRAGLIAGVRQVIQLNNIAAGSANGQGIARFSMVEYIAAQRACRLHI